MTNNMTQNINIGSWTDEHRFAAEVIYVHEPMNIGSGKERKNTFSQACCNFLRLAAVLLVMIVGAQGMKAADYVFMYVNGNTYNILANDNTNYAANVTTFSSASCVWTGSSGSSFSNQNRYIYYESHGNTVRTYTNQSDNFTIANNKIYYNSSRYGSVYIRYNNGSWVTSNTNSNNAVVYALTSTAANLSAPTITNGIDEFTSLNSSSTYSHTNSNYTPLYYTLTGASTYYVTEGGTPSAAQPSGTSTGITYTWSFADSSTDDGHARINSSTGEVTYYNSYSSDTNTTIKVTATHTASGLTQSATKTILFDCLLPLGNPTDITATDKTIAQGETWTADNYTLTAGDGFQAYSYVTAESDNTSVATVANNAGGFTVTGVEPGSATITISAYKQGNTEVACTTTFTLTVSEPSSGVSGGTVTLNDYEDHTWTYYSGVDASVDGGNYNTNYAGKLYSPNPRNVKITYNGVNGVSGSNTAVKVSVESGETQNQFVYYKTLEQGSTSGEYPYQVISNPFSVRPSTGSGSSKVYYGFAGWKIKSGGEYIKNHNNNDVLDLDENIVFESLPYPSVNCTSAEIVFETTWTQATVVNGSSISLTNLSSSGTYETNFFVLTGAYTTAWTGNKNVTVTSVYPDGSSDTRSNNNYTRLNVTVSNGCTVKYEYININNSSSTFSMGTGTKTLYIGRGVSNTSANGVVCNLIQGYDNSINSGGLTYTLKIESGIYNYLSYIKGYNGSQTDNTVTGTVSVKGVLGCDYDRAKNDNTKLKIQEQIFMGYANNYALLRSTSAGDEVLNVTLKSGSLNSNMTSAGTADAQQSFYIGIAGQYSPGYRVFTMEGGEMWSLAAGLCQNTATTNSVRFRIKGGLIKGSIYGSAANANSYGYKQMILTGGQVKGWIAGGGNGTSANGGTTTGSSYVYVGGNCRVDSEGSNTKINSSLGGQVFGSGSGVENTTTWGEMLYGTNVVLADNAYIERNAFGGGNFGWTDQTANIYLTGENMSVGNVYGGANQNKGDYVNIYMTGGTVRDGLYGGSNTTGTVSYDVKMQINGGIVGHGSNGNGIFGGGYGSSTRVSQNVEITLGTEGQKTPGVTVYGDVYGGSALGYVNGTAANNTYHTYVTLNKGTINGSLYGGGLGDGSTAANVYGPVQVTVAGGSVRKTDANGANGSGGVYGANNINGAPQRSVNVDIYGTDPAPSANEYALFAVYGGGNQANYTYGNGYPKVTVHNCGNSIEYVYGGGNAAAVASTDVTIWGGNKIGNVFGGGNGTVTAANVTGNTSVKIYGGTIGSVFGGSNSQGNIGGTISVNVVKQAEGENDPCAMHIGEVYGGGNMAASNAGSITIGCTGGEGEGIGDLYGGANAANITGDIALSITGGSINRVFGGNNIGGSIDGGIKVDVNWKTGNDKCGYNYLGSVFGGGNQAAYTGSPAVNILNGTVSGNVYGGGAGTLVDGADRGKAGKVTGNPVVTIGDDVSGHKAIVTGEVYGGGDAADVAGTPVIVVNDCETQIGDLYGGGNAADVTGTNITVNGGSIGMAFGGGHGDKDVTNPSKYADVNGNVVFKVYGGTISKVFAGSNSKGDITGTSELTIDKSGTCEMHITEVYGGGNEAAGNAGTVNIGCTGGSDEGIVDVYGGARNANINSPITLNITGGNVGRVFGGNNIGGNVTGKITVNVNWDGSCSNNNLNYVYGGGNQAAYAPTTPGAYPEVNILRGTINNDVFGGGLGETAKVYSNPKVTIGDITSGHESYVATVTGNVYGGGSAAMVGDDVTASASINNTTVILQNSNSSVAKVFGGGKAAGITGAPTVTINGGSVTTGVYGGCDSSGNVSGDITVNIYGGTLGVSGTPLTSGIFGGGFGSATTTGGNVTVNVGTEDGTKTPTIYGDIYGGSALGGVNDAATDLTKINFLNGTLHGNIYGGGLGDKSSLGEGHSDVAAKVNGQVEVNISNSTQTAAQCKIDLRDASIYGCNNTNGSPQDDVEVNIYKTAYNFSDYLTGDKYKATYTTTVNNVAPVYAINQVFGGGNEANYAPENGLATSTKKATVNIIGCDNTIRRVFGGGNAAASTGVATVINGGRFNYIFGGGNGEERPADVGAGGATLTVHSGVINHLFGGSNTNGTITGPMTVSIDNSGCTEQIKEFFGGGNLAVIGDAEHPVNLSTTIACGTVFDAVYGGSNLANIYGNVSLTIEGGTIGEVYGGSKGVAEGDATYPDGKAANIYGNTELNIHAGEIDKAFGGSNINGNITGSITVNLDWSQGNCGTPSINNIYGASNLAPYSPTTPGNYPAVNIIDGTVTESVFGGGKGESAIVTSNPVVTIGDSNSSHCAIVTENVYGGGDAAAVTGNATVIYNDNNASSTVTKLFGGGNAADVSGTTSVTFTSGKVTGGVYGGCNSTGSVGAVTVALNGGQVGATGAGNSADVYGGGYGSATTTTGNIGVTLNGTTVYGDLYGGSALGSVNSASASPLNTTTVTLSSATLYGSVFGGGKGDNSTTAISNGNAIVNINVANTNLTGIYGGANINGNVKGAINVNINANVGSSTATLDIFGGGYGAATNTEGNVTVTIGDLEGTKKPIIYGDIYGGSALGNVNNEPTDVTTVNFYNGTLKKTTIAGVSKGGNIYGGGLGDASNAAKVNGQVQVNISSSDQTAVNCHIDLREATIYGCNNTNGSPQDDVEVHIYKTAYNYSDYLTGNNYTAENGADPYYAIDQVFGGGNQADYAPGNGDASSTKKAKVYIHDCTNTIRRVFGGGNAAAAVGVQTNIDGGRFGYVFGGGNGEVTAANIGDGGTDLRVHGGSIAQLFGGSNTSGTITGNMGISVDATGACASNMYIAEFFCGSNEANLSSNIDATIGCGTHFGDVYGGCNLADITGSVTLTIVGGTIDNNVYGGSKGSNSQSADISGNVTLNIYGGNILHDAFGGSNINGNIGGSITVNMDWSQASSNCNNQGDLHVRNVYGASNLATYTPTTPGSYPAVNIWNGTVSGSVYGGGYGATAIVTSNPTVTIGDLTEGHEAYVATVTGDVYGGGDAAGVTGNTSVTIQKGNTTVANAYGGGNAAAITGTTTLTMAGGSTSNLYGGGNAAGVSGTATVNMNGGAVSTGIYGGCNSNGTVGGAIAVNVNGGMMGTDASHTVDIFGGGYGASTATGDNVTVTIGDGTSSPVIWGDVYGGSALGNVNDVAAEVTKVWLRSGTVNGSLYGGGLGDGGHAALVNGIVQVVVDGGTAEAVFGCNNVNGSPQQAVTVTIGTDSNVSGGTVTNVYGGGNLAAYSGTGGVIVSMNKGTATNVFGGGLGSTAIVNGNTTVGISGGTVTTNVYGGGQEADVTEGVSVTISGTVATTRVNGDVYGGGALADTNTANWSAGTLSYSWTEVTGLTAGTSSVTGLYVYDSGAGTYTEVTDEAAKAEAGKSYYTNNRKTTVNLLGGLIGNAYGGGLGRSAAAAVGSPGDEGYVPAVEAVEAIVYGDVTVNVSGAAFVTAGQNRTYHDTQTDKDETVWVPTSGCVFGANNIKGTPKGNIRVNVYGTSREDGSPTHLLSKDDPNNQYEVYAVYGGGNLADYIPVVVANKYTKDTKVLVQGCGDVSVNYVYGGGNSASVPRTSVTIDGSFEVGFVFGGGNGNDPILSSDGESWVQNQGANVTDINETTGAFKPGDGAIVLSRGTIHWVYGGSNKRGTCGTISQTTNDAHDPTCPLKVTTMYGAGRNADVESVNIVVNCPGTEIEEYYAGSLNARIAGDVKMTIIGGTLKNVFGGNDAGGSIGGKIEINVQETSDCNPVIIGNLYGGGNDAAYPNTASNTDPKITVNVKSCTRIGAIYGGGRGSKAVVSAPTEVNINMRKGLWINRTANLSINSDELEKPWNEYTKAELKALIEKVSPNISVDVEDIDLTTKTCRCTIKNEIGTIGNVYGGGDAAVVNGNATVNIGTETTVRIMRHNSDGVPVNSNDEPVYDADWKLRTDIADTEIAYDVLDVLGANITGNVYGGGNRANVTGNTFVNICANNLSPVMAGEPAEPTGAYSFDAVDLKTSAGNDFEGVTIQGTKWKYGVFGGGNRGDVLGNSYVNLGAGSVMQSIYGGGCEADVKGNTYVTMVDGYVDDGVYGGGLMGSVGTYGVDTETTAYGHTAHEGCIGKPTTCTGGGKCTVVVSGGQVGPSAAAVDGMNAAEIVDLGFVFGAGRGDVEDPTVVPDTHFKTYVDETDVTISGGLVMASVYGGGENGRVLHNTHVKIQGGQIGCGNGTTSPFTYADAAFFDPTITPVTDGNKLAECSHWPYLSPYEPFDPYTDGASDPYGSASTSSPTDGKTYYGCVFGGGSGYYPYEKTKSGDVVTAYDWLWSAGVVEGNTVVDVTGGHILTNIYGGNEYTDVWGSCTVNFGDPTGTNTPTLGVPRTMSQIASHPLTCYLYGAGKGDQRSHFNKRTNVGSVEVNVTGGIIYGSVFGGGEEGHVKGDVTMTIGNADGTGPVIGTWGTSYVDGNVFGGGRGFSGTSLTAGNVGGSIDLKIKGGKILGSIYGGGRLASVGYGLYDSDATQYGVMRDDDKYDDDTDGSSFYTKGRGHIDIDISGGTIGNDNEYKYPTAEEKSSTGNLRNTSYDSRNQLIHTKGGNVYVGGMGRRLALDNTTVLSNWEKLGCVKSTKLTIRNASTTIKPVIKSNVYGGGEFGAVKGVHTTSGKTYGTEIVVTGGTIGTQIPASGDNPAYYFGSVFGGGMGDETNGGGAVNKHTYVSIETEADVKKDVYGGGEYGDVGEKVEVNMSGGSVGNNLYGGGAFANTNTSNWDATANSNQGGWAAGKTSASSTTYVHLTGGTIGHDVYGGGLGQWGVATKAPKVYGDVHVDLNGEEPSPGLSTPIDNPTTSKGCIVERVFGCNDQNGTPKGHVKVHVHATQNRNTASISNKIGPIRHSKGDSEGDIHYLDFLIKETKEGSVYKTGIDGSVVDEAAALISGKNPNDASVEAALTDDQRTAIQAAAKNVIKELEKLHDYDVLAVYGGGDLASYDPKNTNEYCEVIIDGCDYTSIKQVYGGSNAAPAPATRVRVNSVYVIHELFGGGNGLDDYQIDGVYYENSGANVGYHNYRHYVKSGETGYVAATHGSGTLDDPYKAIENADASTKDLRQTNYRYGTGVATSEIAGGRIHYAYGGSNHRGNIARTALSVYESMDDSCPLQVDETYGAGKDAPQDGDIDMSMDCVREMEEIFGGAKNADVNADITLNITNGSHFKRVFGGNNTTGAVNGFITVNIKESGCEPIIIEELYAGGYLAPYSIYGYAKKSDGSYETETIDGIEQRKVLRKGEEGALSDPYHNPLINVISATRIDNIFGGGYRALVVGSPHINVNMTDGRMLVANKGTDAAPDYQDVNGDSHDASDVTLDTIGGKTRYYVPLPLGTIGTIFGGGNEADIVGDTYVEIGTGKWINRDEKWETEDADGKKYTYEDKTNNKWKWNEDLTTGSWKWYDKDGNEASPAPTPARKAAEIKKSGTRDGEGDVFGGSNQADVTGNTYVTMENGFVEGHIYGGGKMGSVGEYNLTSGKPTSLKTANTGICNVTISGGEVGPNDMNMWHLNASGNVPANDMPDDKGHVFGASKGDNRPAYDNSTFVDKTYVTINGTAWVKGSVFGGGENGHVLHDTYVNIDGNCQIGNGHILKTDGSGAITVNRGVNRRYTAKEWEARHLFVVGDTEVDPSEAKEAALRTAASGMYTASLPECDSWLYGKVIVNNKVVEYSHHSPYDMYAKATGTEEELGQYADGSSTEGGHRVANSGRSFNGSVFGGGSGFFPYEAKKWNSKAGQVEGDTHVTVSGGHIMTSLYGGCEMSSMLGDTHVTMTGGTLGVPRTLDEIAAHPVTCYVFGGGKGEGRSFHDDNTHVQNANVTISGGWVYGSVFGGAEDGHVKGDAIVNISQSASAPESPTYADYYAGRATKIGTWGTSYVDGNIFGGGRGFDGYNLQAGCIVGNTTINITGGTMLGSIYGGGRLGNVGTYLVTSASDHNYGSYKPDVVTTAATYYTAEDNLPEGVEIGDEKTPAVLSEAHGYTTIDISGGVIGNDLEFVTLPDTLQPIYLDAWKVLHNIPYTEFETETVNGKYIHRLKHPKGGCVYGGSMGRLTHLSGGKNEIWPQIGQAKSTMVKISGTALIKCSVFGGSKLGTVNQKAHVNITGGTVNRNVYGGGYGSTDTEPTTISVWEGSNKVNYTFTPMQFSGCVGVGTTVDISGGWVKKIVYGGGKMASVGVPDVAHAVPHTTVTGEGTSNETFTDFGLSWPCEIPTVPGYEGVTRVNITGGRIGLTGKDYMGQVNTSNQPINADETVLTDAQIENYREDNGDIFGAGKGAPGDRYEKVYSANVTRSRVFINLASTADPADYKNNTSLSCIAGSVYGGSESGHVLGDANVTLVNGLIGHAMYGGGKGKETYRGKLNQIKYVGCTLPDEYPTDVYGFTSGKVYGNTYITMKGGRVMRNIYGGGNMASMGKGNYAGGDDDYFTLGYGEKLTNLWTPTTGFNPNAPITESNKPTTMADYFLSSGKTDVKVLGGTVGYIDTSDPSKTIKDGLPYGNVFGGARGEAVPNINVLPPYKFTPTSYSGYVNETSVTIGTAGQSNEDAGQSGKAPRIYGSVYGGGQDGHVRRDALVVVNSGEIGVPYSDDNQTNLQTSDLDSPLWLHRGNVYGSGSGISKYKFDFNNDGDYDDEFTYQDSPVKEQDYCTSAGSVTRFTQVDINGGIIHRNVYGGGSRASVGPPPNPLAPGTYPYKKGDTAEGHGPGKQSQCTVNIKGTVGSPTDYNEVYGGEVYGASRGDSDSGDIFSTAVWTKVNIQKGAYIKGNVFGGGDAGKVNKDTDVIIGEE